MYFSNSGLEIFINFVSKISFGQRFQNYFFPLAIKRQLESFAIFVSFKLLSISKSISNIDPNRLILYTLRIFMENLSENESIRLKFLRFVLNSVIENLFKRITILYFL